jgi:hypothetical protein
MFEGNAGGDDGWVAGVEHDHAQLPRQQIPRRFRQLIREHHRPSRRREVRRSAHNAVEVPFRCVAEPRHPCAGKQWVGPDDAFMGLEDATGQVVQLHEAQLSNSTFAAVRAGVEDNRHSEVEHPDAWADRNLDELDRAYATAVREMSTGAGGAANERGHPIGVPLGVGVWLPVRDVDVRLDVNDPGVVTEVGRDVDRRGHADRRVDGRGGLGGGGEAEDGGCEPASDDCGKSELVHCGACFFLSSVVFEPWRECRGSDAVSAGDDGSFAPIYSV